MKPAWLLHTNGEKNVHKLFMLPPFKAFEMKPSKSNYIIWMLENNICTIQICTMLSTRSSSGIDGPFLPLLFGRHDLSFPIQHSNQKILYTFSGTKRPDKNLSHLCDCDTLIIHRSTLNLMASSIENHY